MAVPFFSPGWTRTNDLVVNSHPLYQLSYRGISKRVRIIRKPGFCVKSAPGSSANLERFHLDAETSLANGHFHDLDRLSVLGDGLTDVASMDHVGHPELVEV